MERERDTHAHIHTYIHPCIHTYIHPCMHACIYIYIILCILYMYLSIYLSINPFIYLPFYLHMFHVSTCTLLSAHPWGSCRAWWISTTASAPGRTQSPSDTLLGARATWTATSHLAMCSRVAGGTVAGMVMEVQSVEGLAKRKMRKCPRNFARGLRFGPNAAHRSFDQI